MKSGEGVAAQTIMATATPAQKGPWARKPVEQLVAETEGGGGLERTVGALGPRTV